jgi:hypothetical protein
MLQVPTALLLHQTPTGRHHDWLIGGPKYLSDPGSRLWTARVGLASEAWRKAGAFNLKQLPDHRRAYLSYHGPLTGGRGHVKRIDQGHAVVLLWREGRIVLDIKLDRFTGLMELTRVSGPAWRGRVIESSLQY